MTWWLLTYLSISCPGWILSGMIPASVTPLVCEQKSEARLVSSKTEAYKLAIEYQLKDRQPKLYFCKGLKCWEKTISTVKSVEIK